MLNGSQCVPSCRHICRKYISNRVSYIICPRKYMRLGRSILSAGFDWFKIAPKLFYHTERRSAALLARLSRRKPFYRYIYIYMRNPWRVNKSHICMANVAIAHPNRLRNSIRMKIICIFIAQTFLCIYMCVFLRKKYSFSSSLHAHAHTHTQVSE